MSNTVSRQLVRRIAAKYGIDPNVFERQINLESGFQKHVTSSAGAVGPAQLLRSTAKGLGVNPDNPVQNLEGGARYDVQQLKRFGSYRKALAAYNAGPGNIGAGLGYADKILNGKNPKASGRFPSASAGSKGGATRTIPGQDRSGERRSLLLNYLLGNSGGDLLNTVTKISQLKDTAPRTVRVKGSSTPVGSPTGKGGVTTLDGKAVAAGIASDLKRAQAAGWTGTVLSGERTAAQEMSAARRFGLQHYGPKGPLGSNHVYRNLKKSGGAVDVSNPDQLAAVLKKLGINSLKRSMANDPGHFSRTGY